MAATYDTRPKEAHKHINAGTITYICAYTYIPCIAKRACAHTHTCTHALANAHIGAYVGTSRTLHCDPRLLWEDYIENLDTGI
jgi:hypothetical protein